MWIRIVMGGIRIAFVSLYFLECGFESLYEGFESPSLNLLEKLQNWRVDWGIRIALLGIRIWPLENRLKCSFVKIFLGIFIYILKHLLSLISKHNMSVLVSSKSTRVQQVPDLYRTRLKILLGFETDLRFIVEYLTGLRYILRVSDTWYLNLV